MRGRCRRVAVSSLFAIWWTGRVAIGGGAHGVNLHIDADELIAYLGADAIDVTKS